jgi:tetratricopeptide (TPR) repeat protein
MTSISQNVIEAYIERVTELSQSVRRIPTSEELERIATELGIGDEEIREAQKQSQDNFTRSKSYLSLKHWDDAIAEVREALVFSPSNLDMLTFLANAYLGRWSETHRREDENNIRATIRQCLAIKPDCEEGLKLLAKLDRAIAQRKQSRMALLTTIGLIFAGLGSFSLFNESFWHLFANKPSKLEQLELQLSAEIQALRQEQVRLRSEILAIQQQESWQNRTQMAKLEEQIERLGKTLNTLQTKTSQLEERQSMPTPPIIVSPPLKNKEMSQSNKEQPFVKSQ